MDACGACGGCRVGRLRLRWAASRWCPLSLQYSGMTYVALLAMLAVILLGKTGTTRRGDLELFLVLGAMTAFVDLLTTPLLTLGWPLGIALALRLKTAPSSGARQDLVFAGRAVGAWFLGYVGAWASKWALGSLVVGTEVTEQRGPTGAPVDEWRCGRLRRR